MEHIGHKQQKQNGGSALNCSEREAEMCARILLACYPNGIPADQEGYLGLLMAVLMGYPLDLVRKAVAPNGIPFDHPQFLPSIGEINVWLSKRDFKLDTRVYPVFEKLPESERKPRPTYEELKRRCHEAGLMIGSKPLEIEAQTKVFREKFGIDDDKWDQIPVNK